MIGPVGPDGQRSPVEPTLVIERATRCLRQADRHLDSTVAARCTPATLGALRVLDAALHRAQPAFLP